MTQPVPRLKTVPFADLFKKALSYLKDQRDSRTVTRRLAPVLLVLFSTTFSH